MKDYNKPLNTQPLLCGILLGMMRLLFVYE